MKIFLKLIRKNIFFYNISLALIMICICYLVIYSKAEGFMLLNSFHTDILTNIFQQITFFGDGLFTIIVVLLLLIFSKKHKKLAVLLLLAYSLSGALSQIIKNIITAPRPCVYFEYHNFYLDTFATGNMGFSSFPSGHTASAFAMATVFANYFKNRTISIFSIMFGLIIGYSRIYLANHFLVDVLVGAFLGILLATLSIPFYKVFFIHFLKGKKKYLLENKNNGTFLNPTTNL